MAQNVIPRYEDSFSLFFKQCSDKLCGIAFICFLGPKDDKNNLSIFDLEQKMDISRRNLAENKHVGKSQPPLLLETFDKRSARLARMNQEDNSLMLGFAISNQQWSDDVEHFRCDVFELFPKGEMSKYYTFGN